MESTLKLSIIFSVFSHVTNFPFETLETFKVLTKPNLLAGRRLDEWSRKENSGNPEEQGGYFEGDIIINFQSRNVAVTQKLKWKNGIVPYVIKGDFSKLNL